MTDQLRAPFTAAEQDVTQYANGNPQLDILNYQVQIERIRALKADWEAECRETEKRRRQRKIEVDIDLLRKQGRIKVDETLLPIRVIDEIIRKEQPLFLNYITSSRRLGIFKNPKVSKEKIARLEQEFTEGLRYSGWTLPYYGVVDGGQLHGWDSVEILYDITRPFKVSLEHVGHEDLVFNRKSIDIQANSMLLRRHQMSYLTLQLMVTDFGFDAKQVQLLNEKSNAKKDTVADNCTVFKVFMKVQKQVYVAWVEVDHCSDWLKAPQPLDLGRRRQETTMQMDNVPVQMPDGTTAMTPVPRQVMQWVPEVESQYPVRIYRYSQTEEKSIAEQKGHAFYDISSQEASTALASLFINGCVRASNIYASAEKGQGTGSMPKKLDMDLEHGCVYNEPIKFWAPPYPDPTMLRGLQFLDVRKQQESGNLAAAVVNRDDSRKTAEELKTAQDETNKLDSVQLVLFSNFMQEVLTLFWYIVQNLALQDQITLLQSPDPATGEEVNDKLTIAQPFDICAAGDVDVVERQERIQKRFSLLPVVQMIPELFAEFLKDLLKEMLPEDADRYIQVLEQSLMFNKDAMIMSLASMLQQAVTDESGAVKPEFKAFEPQLQQVAAVVQQLAAQKQQGATGKSGSGPAQGQMNMQTNNMMSQTIGKGPATP